jgi:trigger factor
MRSTSEALEGNRVKLTVEVDEEELQSAVDDTFRRLAQEIRVPGFRPGKVPRRLLEVRLGSQAIREEVIRQALPDYYAQAVEEAALDTIAAPEIDITAGEDAGALAFDAVVEVRPKVSIAGYEGLVVTLTALDTTDEEIDARVDRLREQFAELNDVERPATDGDLVTVDIQGIRDGEPAEDLSADDFNYEVGTGGIIEGADEKLRGTKAGDIVEVDAPDLQGGPGQLRLLVKQVREKVLPDADDAWASDASEFDTIDELRADLGTRVSTLKKLEAQLVLRERAVEALAELVSDELPATLVAHEVEHVGNRLVQRLASQGVALQQYLEASGQDESDLQAELERQAEGQVRADLALRALADTEEITATDEELVGEIERMAAQSGRKARDVASRLAESGGLEQLRSEVRNSKAVAWLVEHVDIVDEQGKPVDRALLFESEGSSDQPDGTDEVAAAPDADEEPGSNKEG